MLSLEAQLRLKLLDDFSQQVLTGALRVVADAGNPIRLNLFAAAVRELFGHTLKELAPDEQVNKCDWYKPEPNINSPTRRQRAKYAAQGGLPDAFIAEAGVDVARLHDPAIAAIKELSKYTHVRPPVVVTDASVIDAFVGEALSALLSLFVSFEECRKKVLQVLYDNIDKEVTNAFVFETLQEIDELATHHTIDEAYINDLEITDLTDSDVHFRAEGSLSVELQWGSNSDRRRGDGATMRESFPFVITMRSPVDDVTAFVEIDHMVDTREWFGEEA